MYLGPTSAIGVLDPNNVYVPGAWTVTFDPAKNFQAADADFEIWHGSVKGPGGSFLVYIDNDQFGVGENGAINEYAPAGGAMYLRKGQFVRCYWNITTPPAPKVWFFLRTPEVGKLG